MKILNINILILYSIVSSFQVTGQCTTDELFPVGIGTTKFQAINTLNLRDNIYEIRDYTNYWDKPIYLSGDSVYYSLVNFKFKSHICLKSNDNVVLLTFSDQKLYKMVLRIWFKSENFSKCLENYNQILESLKKEFPFSNDIIINNSKTQQQVGEGYWLYKSEKEKDKDKLEQVEIGYTVEYEKKWNDSTGDYYKTGKIDSYLLEIDYVNCKGTKLDRRGY